MSSIQEALLPLFLVFCRLGGCFLLAPGLSSVRVAARIRLLMALALSLAVGPLVLDEFDAILRSTPDANLPYLIVNESAVGLTIGLLARMFILAIQFAATTMSNLAGLSGIPGVPMEDSELLPALSALMSAGALVLMFSLNMHAELLWATVESYRALPPGVAPGTQWYSGSLVEVLDLTFNLALRLSAPFIIYGLVTSLAVGLANRFTPQLPVYQVLTGVVLLGGMLVLYLLVPEILLEFAVGYRDWLAGIFQ
jgi:flagellar biosynthetic protein FliR